MANVNEIKITDYQLVDPIDKYEFKILVNDKKYKCHDGCRNTFCKVSGKFRPYPCHYHFIYNSERCYGQIINPDKDLIIENGKRTFILVANRKKFKMMIGANIVPIECNKGSGVNGICEICRINHDDKSNEFMYFNGNRCKQSYCCKQQSCIDNMEKIILTRNPECYECQNKVSNMINLSSRDFDDSSEIYVTCSPHCMKSVQQRLADTIKCIYCLKFSKNYMPCNFCDRIYCSKKCKLDDWNGNHKEDCLKLDPGWGIVRHLSVTNDKKELINEIDFRRELIRTQMGDPRMLMMMIYDWMDPKVMDGCIPIDFVPNDMKLEIAETKLFELLCPITYNQYNKLLEQGYMYDKNRPFPICFKKKNKCLIWKYPDENYSCNGLSIRSNPSLCKQLMNIIPIEDNSHMIEKYDILMSCWICGEEACENQLIFGNVSGTTTMVLCDKLECYQHMESIILNENETCYKCSNKIDKKWIISSNNGTRETYVALCSKKCGKDYSKFSFVSMVDCKCAMCGQKSGSTYVCRGCKSIKYCSSRCMKMDLEHKLICDKTRKDGESDYFVKKCDSCYKFCNDITFCNNCMIAKYCSKECQVKHWKEGHKKECKLSVSSDS